MTKKFITNLILNIIKRKNLLMLIHAFDEIGFFLSTLLKVKLYISILKSEECEDRS